MRLKTGTGRTDVFTKAEWRCELRYPECGFVAHTVTAGRDGQVAACRSCAKQARIYRRGRAACDAALAGQPFGQLRLDL